MGQSVKELLIKKLANGQFVSGQQVGEELGISRAAVSTHIAGLVDMGIDIYSVTGKGYRLAQPMTLLDKVTIVDQFTPLASTTLLEVHSLIDSTNSYLMRRIPHQIKHGQVVIAEHQSAGRGRRGRQWVSPFSSHIYLSMYWYLEQGMSAAMGLSVVTALAVSDAIKSLYNIDVQLKWPNDIYLNGVKLAGILIDLEGQALEPCHSVIGLGLNVNMPDKAADTIEQPWTDLQSNTTATIDRNSLVAAVINQLHARLTVHKEHGIATMLDDWHSQDVYLNKPVKLITGDKETRGICRGINTQGALLLEVDDKITTVYGGEVSLRKG